jgi:multiple sugar transport system ATP-binding protein
MTVADNMAFSLKMRKADPRMMQERVAHASKILNLDPYLKRFPRELSGGQRQRVAMGRAIVRDPKVFLFDEPLSNLDAKLRVQTRSEISRIQNELGVTTIYVTHDQVEAMTMGDRVAVMRKGVLQQVDEPQTLYEHPENLFVAGFIGSPAMNLLEASLRVEGDDVRVEAGRLTLPIPPEVLTLRPGLRGYEGRMLVLGVRPEDMEDASLVSDAPADRRISVLVDLVEALGSDVVVHFVVDAPAALTDDVKELAVDVGVDLSKVEEHAARGHTNVIARLNPRTHARKGEPIDLVVDTHRLHFFDADTGLGIYG